jgi:hypothetical protein
MQELPGFIPNSNLDAKLRLHLYQDLHFGIWRPQCHNLVGSTERLWNTSYYKHQDTYCFLFRIPSLIPGQIFCARLTPFISAEALATESPQLNLDFVQGSRSQSVIRHDWLTNRLRSYLKPQTYIVGLKGTTLVPLSRRSFSDILILMKMEREHKIIHFLSDWVINVVLHHVTMWIKCKVLSECNLIAIPSAIQFTYQSCLHFLSSVYLEILKSYSSQKQVWIRHSILL